MGDVVPVLPSNEAILTKKAAIMFPFLNAFSYSYRTSNWFQEYVLMHNSKKSNAATS